MRRNGFNLRLNKQLVENPTLMEPMIVDIKEHGFDIIRLRVRGIALLVPTLLRGNEKRTLCVQPGSQISKGDDD
jgi:hypothetical protein